MPQGNKKRVFHLCVARNFLHLYHVGGIQNRLGYLHRCCQEAPLCVCMLWFWQLLYLFLNAKEIWIP